MIAELLTIAAVASVVFLLVVVGTFLFAPGVMRPEISRFTEKFQANTRNLSWLALILVSVIGPSLFAAGWLRLHHAADFWSLFLAAYFLQVVINLVDLVIFDIAIYRWWYPTWLRFEDYEPIHEYRYHVKAAVKGITVIGMPLSLLAALLALAVRP
ncbi:MAG: hypothetical protein AAGA23_03765 [Pseudomonadota bacterium]